MKSFTHIRIPSKCLVETCSDYDMATLFHPDGTDISVYDGVDKTRKFVPSSYINIPRNLKNRDNDYSGGLIVFDSDNSKRKLYDLRNWLWLHRDYKNNKDIYKLLIENIPKLRKGEYIEVDYWIYPYYFYRV
jgi:hypothetical protein